MLDASLADKAQEMEHKVSFCAGDTCLLHGVALLPKNRKRAASLQSPWGQGRQADPLH